jgi:hypothetical protein
VWRCLPLTSEWKLIPAPLASKRPPPRGKSIEARCPAMPSLTPIIEEIRYGSPLLCH